MRLVVSESSSCIYDLFTENSKRTEVLCFLDSVPHVQFKKFTDIVGPSENIENAVVFSGAVALYNEVIKWDCSR